MGRLCSAMGLAAALVLCGAVAAGARNGSRYGFYRGPGGAPGGVGWGRRMFGGAAADVGAFPAVCALVDARGAARCSGAVVAARWALTAAHCVSPRLAYLQYNSRRPAAGGDQAAVLYLYRHPGYKVVQEDEGRGMDVTVLHHDVGLVRTRTDMVLTAAPLLQPLQAMRLYNPADLKHEEVEVLGFGRTERSVLGEELFSVRLRLVWCARGAWFHCVCGVAPGDARGVCAGDSGGPVLYRGALVGVTSMGPMECHGPGSARSARDAGEEEPADGATSVFTALFNYAELVTATIHDTEAALRMRMINRSSRSRAALVARIASIIVTFSIR